MSEESNKKEELEHSSDAPIPEEEGEHGETPPSQSSVPPTLDVQLSDPEQDEDPGEESTIVDMKRLVTNDLAEAISDLPPPFDPLLLGKYSVIYPLTGGKKSIINVGREDASKDASRLFAVRIVHPDLAKDKTFIEAYRQEISLRKRTRHPNVARILDAEDQENRCFSVEELVLGQNLETVLSRADSQGIKLPEVVLAEILAQVCNGLHAAHEQAGTGDEPCLPSGALSPSNIVISYQGSVKLVDFGVTWAKSDLSESSLTSITETIAYVPPETVLGQDRDQRGDVFTLGIFLYLMTTGTLPFHGRNEAERLKNLVGAEYLTPRAASPEIDAELHNIINNAMSLFPSDRFSSVQEMGQALENYAERARGETEEASLSTFMKQLFASEISDHNTRIQEYYDSLFSLGDNPTKITMRQGYQGSEGDGKGTKRIAKGIAIFVTLLIIAFIIAKIFVNTGDRDETDQKSKIASATKGNTVSHPASVPNGEKAAQISKPKKHSSGQEEETPTWTGKNPHKDNPPSGNQTSATDDKAADNDESTAADDKQTPEKEPVKKVETVTIKLIGLKKGATVYLEDTVTPPPFKIASSDTAARLRVEAPGFKPFEKSFKPNRNKTLRVRLVKEKVAKPRRIREKPKSSSSPTAPKKKKKREKKPDSKKKSSGWEANPFG